MRKFTSCFFVLALAMQTLTIHAQTAEKPAPGFTLTLSMGRHGGEIPKATQVLLVMYTNISKEVDYESNCGRFGALYHLIAVYNGVPVEESADVQKRRKIMEAGRCFTSGGPIRNLQPGQSRQDVIYYNTTKPGTYEFTVEQDAFPLDPGKNVTVKSNTLTIVVPEPTADQQN